MKEKKEYVLITGASSGIGRSIAIELSKKYNIVLNGRNKNRLEETKSFCIQSSKHLIFNRDLRDLERLENNLSSFLNENNIKISYFVHSAGYMKMVPLRMLTVENIKETFAINTFSAALIIKLLVSKRYNKASLKSSVLISSNISNFGAKAFSIYGASKAGLDSLMRNLAVELAPKVRINSVLPGAVETEMTKSIFADKEKIKRMETTYPLGFGKSKDISNIVEFLLSEKSHWITGQQFTVDGGRTINITG